MFFADLANCLLFLLLELAFDHVDAAFFFLAVGLGYELFATVVVAQLFLCYLQHFLEVFDLLLLTLYEAFLSVFLHLDHRDFLQVLAQLLDSLLGIFGFEIVVEPDFRTVPETHKLSHFAGDVGRLTSQSLLEFLLEFLQTRGVVVGAWKDAQGGQVFGLDIPEDVEEGVCAVRQYLQHLHLFQLIVAMVEESLCKIHRQHALHVLESLYLMDFAGPFLSSFTFKHCLLLLVALFHLFGFLEHVQVVALLDLFDGHCFRRDLVVVEVVTQLCLVHFPQLLSHVLPLLLAVQIALILLFLFQPLLLSEQGRLGQLHQLLRVVVEPQFLKPTLQVLEGLLLAAKGGVCQGYVSLEFGVPSEGHVIKEHITLFVAAEQIPFEVFQNTLVFLCSNIFVSQLLEGFFLIEFQVFEFDQSLLFPFGVSLQPSQPLLLFLLSQDLMCWGWLQFFGCRDTATRLARASLVKEVFGLWHFLFFVEDQFLEIGKLLVFVGLGLGYDFGRVAHGDEFFVSDWVTVLGGVLLVPEGRQQFLLSQEQSLLLGVQAFFPVCSSEVFDFLEFRLAHDFVHQYVLLCLFQLERVNFLVVPLLQLRVALLSAFEVHPWRGLGCFLMWRGGLRCARVVSGGS